MHDTQLEGVQVVKMCQSLRTHAGFYALQGISAVSSTRISAPSPIPHVHHFQNKSGAFWFKQRSAKTMCKKSIQKKTVAQTFSVHGAPKNPNSRASSSNGTLVITRNQWKNPPPLVFPMNLIVGHSIFSNMVFDCFTMHFVDFNHLRSPPQMASHHRPRSRSNDPTEPTNTIAMGISPWEKLTESTWQNNHWKYHHQTTQEMWVPNGALPA